jgi:2-dehydropantoate 2-reductase
VRIVIVGSGGVGGYFGAKLAKGGADVTFLARGAHLAAMRENGLRVKSATEGDWTVPVRAVDTLAGQPTADAVLVCVKSYDTEATAEAIRPVVGPGTGILSLQNGIDNEEKLGRSLETGRILGGVCYVFSNIEAPGVIAHHQLGRIVFGELDGSDSPFCEALKAAFAAAAIPAEVSPSIRRTLWEKYVILVALAGTTAVTRLPVSYIRAIPEVRGLWQRQVEELLELARHEQAGLPEDMLARCIGFLEGLAPGNTSSLYQDLAQGRRLELDAFHGHALRLGQRHGVPTPALACVHAALKPYELGSPDLDR